ncbi:hypothetical protein VPH35_104745 [Triticum aestivum]
MGAHRMRRARRDRGSGQRRGAGPGCADRVCARRERGDVGTTREGHGDTVAGLAATSGRWRLQHRRRRTPLGRGLGGVCWNKPRRVWSGSSGASDAHGTGGTYWCRRAHRVHRARR